MTFDLCVWRDAQTPPPPSSPELEGSGVCSLTRTSQVSRELICKLTERAVTGWRLVTETWVQALTRRLPFVSGLWFFMDIKMMSLEGQIDIFIFYFIFIFFFLSTMKTSVNRPLFCNYWHCLMYIISFLFLFWRSVLIQTPCCSVSVCVCVCICVYLTLLHVCSVPPTDSKGLLFWSDSLCVSVLPEWMSGALWVAVTVWAWSKWMMANFNYHQLDQDAFHGPSTYFRPNPNTRWLWTKTRPESNTNLDPSKLLAFGPMQSGLCAGVPMKHLQAKILEHYPKL